MKTIYEVKAIQLKTSPNEILIKCTGVTSTPGWTEIQLSRVKHTTPPADGIQEFEIKGKPPVGMTTQVLTEVTVNPYIIKNIPNWLKGVRIKATKNSLIKNIT